MQKYRAQAKPCRAAYLALLAWDILVTNIACETATVKQLIACYAIRTQIEWVFRVWKSQLRLDDFGNWRLERTLCQLYAHLIAILLCHRLTAGWLWYDGQEHSFSRCVQIIQKQSSGLMRCLTRHGYGMLAWLHRIEDSFRQFGRKTKRKKEPSTLHILMQGGLS